VYTQKERKREREREQFKESEKRTITPMHITCLVHPRVSLHRIRTHYLLIYCTGRLTHPAQLELTKFDGDAVCCHKAETGSMYGIVEHADQNICISRPMWFFQEVSIVALPDISLHEGRGSLEERG